MVAHLKYISLAVLSLQTTVMVLLLRYSRTVPQQGPRYISSTTIIISEIVKIIICFIYLLHESGWSVRSLVTLFTKEIFRKPGETSKIIIPAFLYTIQNNLLFMALSVLDAATYQVTYQLKILTTAMFSVMIIHKRLSNTQWIALVLLTIGVALVQLPSASDSPKVDTSISQKFFGLLIVLVACFSSGFSGVYFEKLVKFNTQSLWIRNIELAFFSILLGGIVAWLQDSYKITESGFFQGYNAVTWMVILLQAFGGLVVATVIKYADNILKGFATSISIVMSTICSYYLLDDFEPSNTFFSGASIVIAATMLYMYPTKKPEKDLKETVKSKKTTAR